MSDTGGTEVSGAAVETCRRCRGAGSVVVSGATSASPVRCRECDGRGSRFVYALKPDEWYRWRQ